MDEVYDKLIRKPLDVISGLLYKIVDLNIIDGIVNAVPKITNAASSGLRVVQTGRLGFYVIAMVGGIIVLFVLKFMI